ncbi:Protein of unknown function [Pseudoxanthomonas sp. GM95]|uniref:DUF2867 domain-containing protein n=1 Tax=Pseudoxanthomonas sp. GM95 TaxID=1881043 RepID=UPI0008D8126F|nr:DUF2867 domain-containing protein [Pseudoxanthomonas sp. GM95]SEK66712.1 Protein of unknown function [Pseudoxanthomonas sp. GM95]
MPRTTQTQGFPEIRLPSSRPGGLPVEVTLVAQLGHGAGDRFHADASARQRQHLTFNADLEEPSARLASPDVAAGEVTSLFSFTVGPGGHPFHRHAGHRIFTAIAGSGGALLRFCDVADAALEADPASFIRGLRQVEIPPDAMFTVRFGGGMWHQFLPLKGDAHPALFALSCHSNELGGALTPALHQQVTEGQATIASLTELLPEPVRTALEAHAARGAQIETVALSLGAAAGTWARKLCDGVRHMLGRLRARLVTMIAMPGFVGQRLEHLQVEMLDPVHAPALLAGALPAVDHRDLYRVRLEDPVLARQGAPTVLASLLDAFVTQPAPGVSALMWLRNVLVRPLRLRRSPLGCPVSSLLSQEAPARFAGRYPVFAQASLPGHQDVAVLLGADDRHLRFRSCVGVRIVDRTQVEVIFGTQVQCLNLFGHLYLRTIDAMHRRYVAPTMLRAAVNAARTQHAFTGDARLRMV